MRKRILKAERKAYRLPRVSPDALLRVLEVVNGVLLDGRKVFRIERYEPERSHIRDTLQQIIRHCDQVSEALEGKDPWSAPGFPDIELKTKRDRINAALEISANHLLGVVTLKGGNDFKVTVAPRRSQSGKEDPRAKWKPGVLPPAEELFRVADLFLWPKGDIGTQLRWDYYRGILELDDLRRLRQCANSKLHDEPYFFLTTKVQRQPRYFCPDSKCRSDFNYQKRIENEQNEGRKGQ